MISIVDYGAGNIKSLVNAINYLGFDIEIINKPQKIEADKERSVAPRKTHARFYSQSELLSANSKTNAFQIPRSVNISKPSHVSSKHSF